MPVMRVLIAAVVCLLVVAPVAAQVPTTSTPLAAGAFLHDPNEKEVSPPLVRLETLRKQGNWQTLQNYAWELLSEIADDRRFEERLAEFEKVVKEQIAKHPVFEPQLKEQFNEHRQRLQIAHKTLVDHFGDVRTTYYNLAWIATDDGKDRVSRLLVRRGIRADQASELPGIATGRGRLVDVFLSDNPDARLHTVYVSTAVPNPVVAQLPDFVGKFDLTSLLGKRTSTVAADEPPKVESPPQTFVSVYAVNLPFERAKITTMARATLPTHLEAFEEEVKKVDESLKLREARGSVCALGVSAQIRTDVITVTAGTLCTGSLTEQQRKDCAAAVKKAAEGAFKTAVEECPASAPPSGDVNAVIAVEQRYKELIASLGGKTVSGESELTNTPKTTWTFGLMYGLLVGGSKLKSERVKLLDSGLIAADPLRRNVTLATVNIHPVGYDPDVYPMSLAERFRFFAGGVLTPDPGLAGGVGFGIVRGLSVNIGAVGILHERLRGDDEVGGVPSNLRDPFKSELAAGFFVGFGYVLK